MGRVLDILDQTIATPRVQVVEEWIGVYVPIALCAAASVLFYGRFGRSLHYSLLFAQQPL